MTYTESQVREKLATDPRWVKRALIRLYERQTRDEQAAQSTRNLNGRGFQPGDAKWFSRFAQYLIKNPTANLSPKQLALCGVATPGMNLRLRFWRGAPAICKYANQILSIMAEDKAAASAAA